MDVSAPRAPRNLPVLAALALVILGAAMSVLTWTNLSEQRQLIDQHVLFAARAILRGVEANLVRVMPMMGRMGPEAARDRLQDVFHEMASSGEVLFLGIYDQDGRLLVSSVPREQQGTYDAPLDDNALADLALTGEWFGTLPLGGMTMLGYAARTRQGMEQICPGWGGGRGGQEASRAAYFLVGLSLDEHYAQFVNFRRAALMQTGFVLGAAALVWLLLVAYMRRREQGQRLVRLESFHSKLLDSMPEAILTVDAAGRVAGVNPAAKAILGPDLVGAAFDALPLGQALREGAQDTGWRQLHLEGRHLEALRAPLDGETLVLVRDRTQLRSLEEDLERSRHLATVGRLAAGVAHEVRNPLSALRGFAQFFASRFKGRDPEQSYADTMVMEADRLGRVVTDLLYLARPREMAPASVDLDGLAGELARLMRFDLERAKATLETDFAAAPLVCADQDALKQALINLLLNALAALGGQGGTITLRSAPRSAPDAVAVEVADTGHGMSEEERQRALEPFFTIRKDGSGLGLAIVHTIVRDHGGGLEIDSAPGRGAVVRLIFPEAPCRRSS